jgi:photosystem II stability/assembly factor-like uncharacterized protein
VPGERVHAGRATRWVACAATLAALCTLDVREVAAAPRNGPRITDNLYDVKFVTPTDGWAVGAFGTIARTKDGGNTWRPQVSHTFEHLYGVDFSDTLNGWIAGRSGLALHTTDGGDTWQAQPTGSERHFFKVQAIDKQRAWLVGDWGAMFATHDGGKTWENHSLPRDVILNSQAWPDPEHGWVVGEAGTIVATQDGGATWTEQKSGVEKTLFGVTFADAQRGWAVGLDGIILHTTDGGQTWQAQHGDTSVGALEQVGFAEALDNPSLYDVAVAGQIGYAVGDIGCVYTTEDGGETWHKKDVSADRSLHWIRAVSLVSGTHGGFVGADGMLMRIQGTQIAAPAKEEHAAEAVH